MNHRIQAMKNYTFTIVYERDEDGRIIAICPALQGCYAEGESEEEARANIREAIEAHIESHIAHGDPIHTEIHSEAISFAL
jgi:predicted RNase H-like HicB family nuclease